MNLKGSSAALTKGHFIDTFTLVANDIKNKFFINQSLNLIVNGTGVMIISADVFR